MITIITGTPGNGKTAHAVDLVWLQDSIWKGLDKYSDGIAELTLPHFDFPALAEVKSPQYVPLSKIDSDDYAVWQPSNPLYAEFTQARATAKYSFELWFLWAQPNSVIVIDEAQRFFRPRPSGSRVPLYIQLLEYHRHFGIHLVLITQKERLIDSNVRMLSGQHIHITNSWRGRHLYEWPEVKDTDSKIEKQLAAQTKYKLPKHVFPMYKSATAHLKVEQKTPFYFKVAIASLLLVPVLAFFAYSHFKTTYLKDKSPEVPALALQSSASGVLAVSTVPASGVQTVELDRFVKDFTPVVPARPETAPAYNDLRKVASMPLISACISSSTNCKCYTQQGSVISDISLASCRSYLEQGRHFNPYAQPVQQAANPPASASKGVGDTSLASADSGASSTSLTAQDVINLVGKN